MSSAEPRRLELPAPVLLEVRGPDGSRYLNGQVTQDVRLAGDATKSLHACVTDAKGKLQFRVAIHGRPGGVLRVSCDHEGADGLLMRLDRYLIADDAEIVDISEEWKRIHVTGGEAPVCEGNAYAVAINRISVPGWDVWIPCGESHPAENLPAWSSDETEAARIAAGIPAWGKELEAGMLPPEAGLDRTDISYAKGCYIGQEVISRIKSAGKVNRRLTKLVVPESVACVAGDALLTAEGTEAGVITSVSPIVANARRVLLGYVKRSVEGQGLRLADQTPVEIIAK
ncbi:hypothetical protein KBB96_12815 [Luteolibacter ambystomatis]|uniref:Folate-binding protein n=1 Tax=Luteolibacter ambystomatis TaxID=2824561 RepID=A0A975G5L0_9BACT|nr:hypothetical protein [Luteolibacter ambystomatis]QUE49752.1 hypothetical protein KBB96_12815 [Luteolibacter ambystomatis]